MTLIQEWTAVAGDQEVLLRWLEQSTHIADQHSPGWIIHMVEARCGETFVGHLRVEYVTRESSYAGAPDGLHFMSEHRGWCLDFDDPKHLWCQAHLYARKTPRSLRNLANPPLARLLSHDDAPTLDVIEHDLAELHEIGERERQEQLVRSGTPVTAFARVDDTEPLGTNWQRRGIARAMYRLAAQELGTRGMVLRASTLQSEAAQALWANFESDPQMPTRRVKLPWARKPSETGLVLDYRK